MKIPKTPPDWRLLFTQCDKDVFQNFFTKDIEQSVSGKYPHWDKLRFYKPPDGLTREQWWTAIKVGRTSRYQNIELQDTKGQQFQFLVPTFVQKALHWIDQHAGGELLMSELPTAHHRNQRIISSLMEEAVTSSQLEGAAVTREVARTMLKTGRQPKSRDELMILNNYQTMRELKRLKDEPLSPGLILEIHKMITQDTLKMESQAGRYRTSEELVDIGNDFYDQVYHVPPPARELERRVNQMCEFANSEELNPWIHPVIRSVIIHFWLAYDHPFVDGNGRTARALFYWSMLRHNYWLIEFVTISRILNRAPVQYYKAFLHTETDENDLTYFIVHQIGVLETAINELRTYLQKKQSETVDADQLIKKLMSVNLRQRNLLNHALRHPDSLYTFAVHRDYHGISQQTARTDLQGLERMGLLQKIKDGRKFAFSPTPDLVKKVKELGSSSKY